MHPCVACVCLLCVRGQVGSDAVVPEELHPADMSSAVQPPARVEPRESCQSRRSFRTGTKMLSLEVTTQGGQSGHCLSLSLNTAQGHQEGSIGPTTLDFNAMQSRHMLDILGEVNLWTAGAQQYLLAAKQKKRRLPPGVTVEHISKVLHCPSAHNVFYLDVKENALGFYLKLSQVSLPDQGRRALCLPLEGLAELIFNWQSILGPPLSSYNREAPVVQRVGSGGDKSFDISVRQNEYGRYLMMTEGKQMLYRNSIMVPESLWLEFYHQMGRAIGPPQASSPVHCATHVPVQV